MPLATSPISAAPGRFCRWLIAVLVVLVVVAVPRLPGLSGLPLTDEGYYAYYAMRIHEQLTSGGGLPGDGYLMLYPLVSSWVWSLPQNGFVMLRSIDLVVSCAAGLLLFAMIRRESRSLGAAVAFSAIFLFAMNAAPFIQNGFKNSFHAAYVPLLTALLLSQRGPVSLSRWSLIGGLVAVAVLLRESFAPFAVLAVGAVCWGYGRRPALALCAGAAVTTTIVLLALLGARGGVAGLIGAYQDASITFAAVQDQRSALFVSSFNTAVGLARLPVVLWLLALTAVAMAARGQRPASAMRGVFWILASLLPLIEPASKIGFAYHFSACLPGMAGLCAWAWQSIPSSRARVASLLLISAAALWYTAPVWSLVGNAPDALGKARLTAEEGWPDEAHVSTNYLIAADLVGKNAPAGGTLSVSGFMFPLFPLTGLQPSSPALSDLSLALIKHNMNGVALAATLAKCAPDVVLVSNRTEFPGAAIVQAAVESTGLYQRVGVVEVDATRSYGTFGGIVYRKIAGAPRTCLP